MVKIRGEGVFRRRGKRVTSIFFSLTGNGVKISHDKARAIKVIISSTNKAPEISFARSMTRAINSSELLLRRARERRDNSIDEHVVVKSDKDISFVSPS